MTNPIIEAVVARDGATAARLAAAQPDLTKARDEGGLLPAVHALYNGLDDIAETLLPSDDELTIFEAALFARVDRVADLLEREGESVSAYSSDGFTPLHLAAFSGSSAVARLLIEAGADLEAPARSDFATDVRPLQTAAFARAVDVARLLLDAGAQVEPREAGGFTPLHTAAANGDRAMVDLLLERGADVAVRDDEGRTPADVAEAEGNDEVAARLVGRVQK